MIKTALIVDNSRFVRCYLKEILKENNIEVVAEAEDVKAAIDAYDAHKPDLITLDLIMPGGSGLLVLEDIRAKNTGANIIIISDVGPGKTKEAALAMGATAVLRKPLTSDALKEMLAQINDAASAASDLGALAGKPRALIVDDSQTMRIMVRGVLEEYGFTVVGEADDVQAGIDAYEALRPDVTTVDIVMPGGSGMDVLKRIKWINPDARVIVVTSLSQDKVREELMGLGALSIIHKPLTIDQLRDALKVEAHFAPSAVKQRALVVDDSMMMRVMIREMMETHGFEVIGEACDVPEGIKAYHALRPDIVTVDLVMPGGSGMDVLRSIKATDPHARVIMVTSVSQEKVKEELLSLGALSVLNKPLTGVALKAALELDISAAAKEASGVKPAEVEALKKLLEDGARRSMEALNLMCNKPWSLAGIEIGLSSDQNQAAMETMEAVSIQMTVAGDVPMVCLFLVPQDSAERMAALMIKNPPKSVSAKEAVALATGEWGNIMITNVLNVLADHLGSAILSSPPDAMAASVQDVINGATAKISVSSDRVIVANNMYSCKSLGIRCETFIFLSADCLHRFIGG